MPQQPQKKAQGQNTHGAAPQAQRVGRYSVVVCETAGKGGCVGRVKILIKKKNVCSRKSDSATNREMLQIKLTGEQRIRK